MNDPDVRANDIFPFSRRVVPIAVVAAGMFALTMVAIIVGLGRKPPYDVLFAGLSPDAVASIVAQLRADNVPYDVTEEAGRATIRIPVDQLSAERIRILSTAPRPPASHAP
jgi:flagellar M-ring protein FliF